MLEALGRTARLVFGLALRRLAWQAPGPLVLVGVVAITAWLPWTVAALGGQFEAALVARAATVPLVVGAPGSRVDLVLAALWLRPLALAPVPASVLDAVNESGLALGVPLALGPRARGETVVGTGPEYFALRNLQLAAGHPPRFLGEAVLGAQAAARLGLGVGAALPTDPERPYDLTRTAALRLRVVGVLAATHGPEDEVVLVDVRTVWAASGHIHGHRAAVQAEVGSGDAVFQEATAGNRATFHAHGDPSSFPLSAVLVLPHDAKAGSLLRARLDARAEAQAVVPTAVVDELLGVVLRVRRLLVAQQGVVAVTTVVLLALVGVLSIRLRADEVRTLVRLGAPRRAVVGLFAVEWLVLVALGLAVAAGLVAVSAAWAPAAWQWS